MIYKYKGFDSTGKTVKSSIEASSIEEAKQRLRSQNILYQSIQEASPSILKKIRFSAKKQISYNDLSILSRDLSIYIKSGISIVNAIKLALNQYKNNKKHTLFLNSITTFLDEGKNFYQALENQTVYEIPSFFKQSVKVSENSGILGEVLLELSTFLKEQDRINKQVKNAMAYPMFILFVSVFIVIFMMSFVVPKITSIFDQLDQQMPQITLFVIATGDFFSKNWAFLVEAIIVTSIAFVILKKTNKTFRLFVDKTALKVPLLGSILLRNEMGRFSYVSHILIRSGIPFAKTINLASKILNNEYLQKIFSDASEKVVEGDRLSSALQKNAHQVGGSFIQAIALGEETSQTSLMLENLSQLYFEENKDKISLFLSLLEPALMLSVGLVVGFIITAMLLPIFSINLG